MPSRDKKPPAASSSAPHIGLVIPVRGRSAVTRLCLEKLRTADIDHTLIVLVDDGSEDSALSAYLQAYQHAGWSNAVEVLTNPQNLGVGRSLARGFEHAIERGCELLVNLDSDAYVNNDFLTRLLAMRAEVGDAEAVYTAFNEKAHIDARLYVRTRGGHLLKNSGGGINYLFHRDFYPNIKRAVKFAEDHYCPWDMALGTFLRQTFWARLLRRINVTLRLHRWRPLHAFSYRFDHYRIYGLQPSALQHIGVEGIHTVPPDQFISRGLYAGEFEFDSDEERRAVAALLPVFRRL